MDRNLVLLVGVFAVTTGAVAWSMERSHFSPNERQFSSGFTKHVLAIELVRTKSDVAEIVGELGDPNREIMSAKVQKDFAFIPSYAFLFAVLGWLLGRSNYRWALWPGAAIGACAAGAAFFDFIENLRILAVLDTRLADTTSAMVDSLRTASLTKWAFVFISLVLLSPIVFLRRELFTLRKAPRLTAPLGVLIALFYLLAAAIGMIGLLRNPLIEKASMLMSLALLSTVLLLLIAFFAQGRRPNRNVHDGADDSEHQQER